MKRPPRQSGFTLLELILVMVIICTALALAAPSLNGWARGSKMRDAVSTMILSVILASGGTDQGGRSVPDKPCARRVDKPALLDGAAGIAMVLLAASQPVAPWWDRLFLLS